MQLPTMPRDPTQGRSGNGGFPEPPAGESVRLLRCLHPACGTETSVRLPASLPTSAVQRIVCDGCHESFEFPEPAVQADLTPEQIIDPAGAGHLAPSPPARSSGLSLTGPGTALLEAWDRVLDARDAVADRLDALPRPEISRARLWTWASVPLAALGVVAGLALLQGDGAADSGTSTAATIAPKGARGGGEAKFIQGAGYSLALPSGWKQVDPPDGAAFAARSKDGLADATLWISKDGDLGFKQFEQRSLKQLSELGENARIVDRVPGPTIESTITELRADAPVADGVTAPIRVTLRGAGNYRLFFTSAQQPGAGAGIAADIETMHASLRPDVEVKGLEDGS